MLIGEVFLETMATGVISQAEIDWLTTQQGSFSREEEAMALKIGRLLDEGQIQIGCRLLGAHDPQQLRQSTLHPSEHLASGAEAA